MAGNLEQRVWRLENGFKQVRSRLDTISGQLAALAQQQYANRDAGGGGNSALQDNVFFFSPPTDFSAGYLYPGAVGAGPSVMSGQTVYKLVGQILTSTSFTPAAEQIVTTGGTVYNVFNEVFPANQPCLLMRNSDGSYTVVNRNQDWCGYGNCLFPQKNLTLSWAINNLITGPGLGSGPLTYMGNCTYVANCLNTTNNVASTKFTMVVSQSCTYVQANYYRGANCAAGTGLGTLIYDDPNGCSGIFGGQLNLNHFTCSPLLYQWISVVGNPAWTVSL